MGSSVVAAVLRETHGCYIYKSKACSSNRYTGVGGIVFGG